MAKQGVRRKVSLQDPVPARTEEIPRHVRLLALAHRWHRLIDSGEVRDQAAIAHATGLTRARVTQIMDLRWLCPALQRWLTVAPGAVQSERKLREVAGLAAWNAHDLML